MTQHGVERITETFVLDPDNVTLEPAPPGTCVHSTLADVVPAGRSLHGAGPADVRFGVVRDADCVCINVIVIGGPTDGAEP